jgi:hypothetical protein
LESDLPECSHTLKKNILPTAPYVGLAQILRAIFGLNIEILLILIGSGVVTQQPFAFFMFIFGLIHRVKKPLRLSASAVIEDFPLARCIRADDIEYQHNMIME